MTWHCELVLDSADPLYAQIVSQARRAILRGILPPGTRLPPVRVLAAQLHINPNTVARAYTELARLGLLQPRSSRGLFVATRRPSLADDEKNRRLIEAAAHFVNQIADLELSQDEILGQIEAQLKSFRHPA